MSSNLNYHRVLHGIFAGIFLFFDIEQNKRITLILDNGKAVAA